jgi:hypothetical protein
LIVEIKLMRRWIVVLSSSLAVFSFGAVVGGLAVRGMDSPTPCALPTEQAEVSNGSEAALEHRIVEIESELADTRAKAEIDSRGSNVSGRGGNDEPTTVVGCVKNQYLDQPLVDTASLEDVVLMVPSLYGDARISEALVGLSRGEAKSAERGLKALAVVGTPDIKARLVQVIFDEEESDALRVDLIGATDWSAQPEELLRLLGATKNEFVKQATILAAQQQLQQSPAAQQVEDALVEHFLNVPSDQSRIEIIDYLANNNPSRLERLELDAISDLVREHIEFVSSPAEDIGDGRSPEPGLAF